MVCSLPAMNCIRILSATASITALCTFAHGAAVNVGNFNAPFPIVNQANELILKDTGYIGAQTRNRNPPS